MADFTFSVECAECEAVLDAKFDKYNVLKVMACESCEEELKKTSRKEGYDECADEYGAPK